MTPDTLPKPGNTGASAASPLGPPSLLDGAPTGSWFAGLLEQVRCARDWRTLRDLCQLFATACGYDYFLYGFQLPYTSEKYSNFMQTTYPQAWLDRYDQKGYLQFDPVVSRSIADILPYDWSEVSLTTPESLTIFKEAAKHGLKGGFSVPTRGNSGAAGLLNISSASPKVLEEPHRSAILSTAMMFALTVLRAAVSLAESERAKYRLPRRKLTDRQREVVVMIAQGLSVKEICRQMDLHRRTVDDVVRVAMEKLGAHSREDMLVRASVVGIVGWGYTPASLKLMEDSRGIAP